MQWCQVKVIPFPFEEYPMHVRRLKIYSFKPLLIQVGPSRIAILFASPAFYSYL